MTTTQWPPAACPEEDFDELIRRVRAGDSLAEKELWARFVGPMLRHAQRKLDEAIRLKVDANDIVQSAYHSFFFRLRSGKFELPDADRTLRLLICITQRKCRRKAELYYAQRRDIRRESPVSASDDGNDCWPPDGNCPMPDEEAITNEIIDRLTRELTRPYERQILCRLLEGWSIREISADVPRSEYTVNEVVKWIRRRLEQMRDEDD